jgi:hypothetical protein
MAATLKHVSCLTFGLMAMQMETELCNLIRSLPVGVS